MSDLQFNKFAGAALATGLALVGLNIVSEMIFAPDLAEKPGYAIAVAEVEEGGAAAAAGPADWGTVLPAANVAMGATVSKKCVSCHTFEKGAANGTGPNLWGVLGKDAGVHPGFAYSEPMVAHGPWTYDDIDAFLAAPQKHVPGTKMSFVGLKKQDDRINLIAYLRSMHDAAPAIPAPDPSRAPGASAAGAAAGTAGAAPTDDNNSTSTEGTEGTAGVVAAESDRQAAGGAVVGGGVAGQAPQAGVGQAPTQDRSNPGGAGTGPTGQDAVRQSGQGAGQSARGGQSQ
jgi:cytochrome c